MFENIKQCVDDKEHNIEVDYKELIAHVQQIVYTKKFNLLLTNELYWTILQQYHFVLFYMTDIYDMTMVCGPSQSGKTYWIFCLLENIERMVSPVPKQIVYLHNTDYQPIFDEMKNVYKRKKKLGLLDLL